MKEELVTFETAKLANKKGFNIKCSQAFWYNSIHYEDGSSIDWLQPIKDSDILKLRSECKFEIGNPFVYRPTQSLLQRWLRVNYNIIAVVKPITHSQKFGFFVTGKYQEETRGYLIPYNFKPYDTWEEALEEALKQSLQLINIQNKNENTLGN